MQRSIPITVSLVLIGVCLGRATGRAQTPDHLAPLTLPPATVGTCTPIQTAAAARRSVNGRFIAHHLVMVSQPPGARREITVFSDSLGRAVLYAEISTDFQAPAQGTGSDVVARLTPAGSVAGTITRTVTTMTPPTGRIDSASLRKMRETAKSRSTKAKLDATQQRAVGEIARWLIRRCPA